MSNTLSLLIDKLQFNMQTENLWSHSQPDDSALASALPFAVDTLRFEQWLQYIFIVKMKALLTQDLPLPNSLTISPMAEQSFSERNILAPLTLQSLKQIDMLFNA